MMYLYCILFGVPFSRPKLLNLTAGLIKCICMLNYSTGAPNVHLFVLNPHLDVAGGKHFICKVRFSSFFFVAKPDPKYWVARLSGVFRERAHRLWPVPEKHVAHRVGHRLVADHVAV